MCVGGGGGWYIWQCVGPRLETDYRHIYSFYSYEGGDFTKGSANVPVRYCVILTLLSAPLSVGSNRSLTLKNLNGFLQA